LAMAAAACLLRVNAPAFVSEAFTASRLDGPRHRTYGAGLGRAELAAIIARASPGTARV